jgi:CDP-diacylglycerol--glycerol-3-phosphate 3-phosphatidyltransferase
MNVPNLVTALRFPLLVAVVLMLYLGGAAVQFVAVGLVVILLLMDSLDGILARRLGQQTLVGSALDIAADRAVEIVFWVVFAHMHLIPVAIPVIVVIRGALTDSIRSVALQQGQSAHTMMRSKLGRWLVAAPPLRSGYGIAKGLSFGLLALSLALGSAGNAEGSANVLAAGVVLAWVSVALCILRGVPVIVEAPALFATPESS